MNRSLRASKFHSLGSLLALAGLALACSSNAPHSGLAVAGASGVPGGAGQGNLGTGGASGAPSNPGGGSSGMVNIAGDNGGTNAGGMASAGGGTSEGGASGGAAGAPPVTSGSFPQLAKSYSGIFSAPPKLSVMSFEDDGAYQQKALSAVSALAQAQADVDSLLGKHHAWWDAFYAKSFVEIPNKVVEKEYYGSLYLLACVSRTGEAAAGLWGNWVMKNADWNGDYTLNYNYEAPFCAAFPTNHPELADSYDKPVIDWMPKAQAEAIANKFTGAFYRVHIGPLPDGSGDTNLWNQKFNGAFAVSVSIMHYYFTLDAAYAAKIYPTLKQIAIFWQNYLTKDDTRYVIENDAQHEGNAYPAMSGKTPCSTCAS